MGCRLLCLAVAVDLLLPASAGASGILGATNGTVPTLQVNRQGIALVTFTTFAGKQEHVLAWGAINGVAHPTGSLPQQRFKLDYSGGWKSRHNSNYWKTFRNGCT